MKKNIVILFVAIGIVVSIYLFLNYKYIIDSFQDLPKPTQISPEPTNTMAHGPFIYAGYHEIYDYIISSALIKHINNQIQLTSSQKPGQDSMATDVISFESIPRVYVYISEASPEKAHLVFTKLKKSNNLIRLYNKQINSQKLPDKDIDKTVSLTEDIIDVDGEEVRNAITNQQYSTVMSLIKKYDFSSATVDFDTYLSDIKLYIQFMLLANPGFMYNIMLSDAELSKLELTREKVTATNSGLSITLNPGVEQLMKDGANNMFTTVFNNKQLVPVLDNKIRQELMALSTSAIESTIKKYLFKNPLMATNINMKRIALFKMNIVNPYRTHIFYMLKDNTAINSQDELSNKELETKFSKVFTPDLSPEKLAKYAEIQKADPKQKFNINPDRECFVIVNQFQVLRVILKRKESEL